MGHQLGPTQGTPGMFTERDLFLSTVSHEGLLFESANSCAP